MVTVSPQELISVLNLASKAPTTLGDVFAIRNAIDKLVALANQPHPIGAIEPVADSGSSSSDPHKSAEA